MMAPEDTRHDNPSGQETGERTLEEPQPDLTTDRPRAEQPAASADSTDSAAQPPQSPFAAEATAHPFALESPRQAPEPTRQEPKPPEARNKDARDRSKDEASQSPFSVTVGQVYDGPLDLLLDLIRRQNIDIYDIPIGRITAQFLEYTHRLQQTDVDAAGEFIYVASLLIHIKSKTLLPRDPSDTTGTDPEDPRRELVERLLEHERFKAAAQMLQQKQVLEDATWTKPGLRTFLRDEGLESADDSREIAADTVDLVRVFSEVLERLRERPVHSIAEDTVTVAQMIDFVKRRLLMEDRPVSLRRLLHNTRSERALICTFLALLELVRLQAILLRQPEPLGDILIKKADEFEQVFADQAQVRDDWG